MNALPLTQQQCKSNASQPTRGKPTIGFTIHSFIHKWTPERKMLLPLFLYSCSIMPVLYGSMNVIWKEWKTMHIKRVVNELWSKYNNSYIPHNCFSYSCIYSPTNHHCSQQSIDPNPTKFSRTDSQLCQHLFMACNTWLKFSMQKKYYYVRTAESKAD